MTRIAPRSEAKAQHLANTLSDEELRTWKGHLAGQLENPGALTLPQRANAQRMIRHIDRHFTDSPKGQPAMTAKTCETCGQPFETDPNAPNANQTDCGECVDKAAAPIFDRL